MDASCLPADISYPRDINLLNKAREITEKVIDVLYKSVGGKERKKSKPRTYRKLARKDYLAIAKEKNPRVEKRRKGIKKQLAYIERNLSHIDNLLSEGASLESLKRQDYQKLLVVGELYRQQKWMYENQQNRIENRIVSISQPHIRPIVRGKVGKKVEFGAKVSASVIDGYVFIDHISWNNFNESVDLKKQVENYKEYTGYYPESVHADKIYRTRPNIAWCKSKGIRISGLALGRPPKKISKERKKQASSDEKIRNSIEGKFGEGKRRYGLNRIMAKLPHTSLTSIAIIFLVMNLSRLLRQVIWNFFVKNWIIACLTD